MVAAVALVAGLLTGCDTVADPSRDFADQMVVRSESAEDVDKQAVYDLLLGRGLPSGVVTDEVLDRLLRRHWDDEGESVRRLFDWIGQDSRSADAATATRAGEAATVIARFVYERSGELLNVDGPQTASVGEVNPLATQGIVDALSPYIAALAGAEYGYSTPGFAVPTAGNSADLVVPRIFAVAVSGPDSATLFVQRAGASAADVAAEWVNGALDGRALSGLGSVYGTIHAYTYRGLELEAEDRTRDEYGDSDPDTSLRAKPRLKPWPTGLFQFGHEVAVALEDQVGSFDVDPRYSYLRGTDGRLKSYTALRDEGAEFLNIRADTYDIVMNYNAGELDRPFRLFWDKVLEAWQVD
ncbi:hypothetical protein [Nocardia otitidiscaviarum]|uniref:TPR repeat region-containing protein n=1 Tax=Nocardia otitidiscaviarum TaxID=1823 RepID=UPI002456E472|nr:hypothetical protein [Nocardia otitidiscaviarum]